MYKIGEFDEGETLDQIHTLGLPFLACFQWELVEFLVIYPSYFLFTICSFCLLAVFCRVVQSYVTSREFTTHAPLTLSILLIDKRMTARSMTGGKKRSEIIIFLCQQGTFIDVQRPVSQFSLPTGLWTSAGKNPQNFRI